MVNTTAVKPHSSCTYRTHISSSCVFAHSQEGCYCGTSYLRPKAYAIRCIFASSGYCIMKAVSNIRLTRCTSRSARLNRLTTCTQQQKHASRAGAHKNVTDQLRPAHLTCLLKPNVALQQTAERCCRLSQQHRSVKTIAVAPAGW